MTRRTFVKRSRLEASADEVYRWHARPGALERLSPPWDPPVVESRAGTIEDEGARVVAEADCAQPLGAAGDEQGAQAAAAGGVADVGVGHGVSPKAWAGVVQPGN